MKLHPETERMLAALADAFTPATLAAIRVDLETNHALHGRDQQLADEAAERFAKQHVAMVGSEEAERVMQEALFRQLPY